MKMIKFQYWTFVLISVLTHFLRIRFPTELCLLEKPVREKYYALRATFEMLGGVWSSLRVSETGVTGGAQGRCQLQGIEDG